MRRERCHVEIAGDEQWAPVRGGQPRERCELPVANLGSKWTQRPVEMRAEHRERWLAFPGHRDQQRRLRRSPRSISRTAIGCSRVSTAMPERRPVGRIHEKA